MVVTYNRSISASGGSKECKILLFAEGLAGGGSVVTTEGILGDPAVFEALKVRGYDVNVAVLPGLKLPVIELAGASSGAECRDYTAGYQLIEMQCDKAGSQELPKDTMSGIKALFQTKLGMSAGEASRFIAASLAQYGWEHTSASQFRGALRIGVNNIDYDFREDTLRVLAMLNAAGTSMFRSIDVSENYTRYQKVCTDTLFIELPDRLSLLDDDVSVLSLLPKRSEVCEPYTDKAAYTPMYKSASGVPKYMYAAIEGSRENNKEEPYGNEELFRTAAVEWTEHNMTEAYGSTDSGVIDPLSKTFLQELIDRVYLWHWGHNPNVPSEILDIEPDDTDRVDSRYVFAEVPGLSDSRPNAILLLNDFLSEAAAAIGYTVYADALVQLARWGDRKGTALVFEGYQYSFNLGTNTKQSAIGNVSEYAKVQVNGCDSSVCAVIVDDTEIADEGYVGYGRWDVPVGIMTVSTLKDPAGSRIAVYTYYSMIDFVRETVLHGLKVDGASWEEGKGFTCEDLEDSFTIKELLESYEAHRDEELQDPFFRSRALKDLYFELKAGNTAMPETILGLMSARLRSASLGGEIDRCRFSTKEQLYSLLKARQISSVSAAINFNVVASVLPVYRKAQELWKEHTQNGETQTSDLLNVWHRAMVETGFTDEADFYEDRSEEAEILDGVSPRRKDKVQPIKAFGQKATEDSGEMPKAQETLNTRETAIGEETQKGAVKPGMSFVREPHGDRYVHITDGGEILGVCAVDVVPMRRNDGQIVKFPIYTVIDDSAGVDAKGEIPALTICAYLVHSACSMETGASSAQQLFFDSAETMRKFRNSLSERGRKDASNK